MKTASQLFKKLFSKTWNVLRIFKVLGVAIIAIGTVVYFSQSYFIEKSIERANDPMKIQAPIANIDIKHDSFKVDVESGDTITCMSGTQIIVPGNCFVDKNGNKLEGKVDIQFREFRNPLDIMLCGIPMVYDSGGVKNNFESAGMIEINGYQNNEPIFIDAQKSIKINIASTVEKEGINLYRFDTLQKNWTMLGKDSINDALAENATAFFLKDKTISKEDPVKAIALKLIDIKQENKKLMHLMPIKPRLFNSDKSNFMIDFDKEDFSELCSFENVRFEICDSTINIAKQDTATIWEDVRIERGVKNTYEVYFSTQERSVNYKVIPVFDSMNINNASAIFEEKYKQYHQKISENKIAAAQAQRRLQEELLKARIEAEKAREKALLDEQKTNEIARAEAIEKMKEQALQNLKEQQQFEEEQAQRNKQMQLQNEENIRRSQKLLAMGSALTALTRSFEMNEFGIYNCDRIYAKGFKDYNIKLNIDEKHKIIALYSIYKKVIGAINCMPVYFDKNMYSFKYANKEDCKLVALFDSKQIGICEGDDLAKAMKTQEKEINFNVTTVDYSNQSEILSLISFKNE